MGGFNARYTQGLRRGTISLPRIASHIGATASTTSVLTGRTENSPRITFSSPPTYLPHPESPFEDVALLSLFLGVDLDLATAFEAIFLLLSSSRSPPDGKSQAEEKQVGALLQHLLPLSNLKFVADVVVFANVLLFLHRSLCFAKLTFVSLSSACPFGVG